MYWKYGAHQHENGEVNLTRFEARALRTPRGLVRSILYSAHLEGVLYAATPLALSAACTALELAYSGSGKDAGLYMDDGTVTSHFLEHNHADNITGNQVVAFNYPLGGPEEFANGRSYAITVQAEYSAVESEVVSFSETLDFTGNCGPIYEMVTLATGLPVFVPVTTYSYQTIYQHGNSVGLNGYYEPFGAMWPAYELTHLRRWSRGGPQFRGQQFTDWPMEWSYVMVSSTALDGTPNMV